jgi:hypothetical protein
MVDPADPKQVGKELYEALKRLTELLRLYEAQQWPPARAERFDVGLSAMVADPQWRQGTVLRIQEQRKCAAALEGAGMSAIAAQHVAGFKRDKGAKQ